MEFEESSSIELKREFSADVKKEIIAFANSDGGTIYIGINDAGMVVGVNDAEQTALQITNTIRDAIKPDLTLFTSCTIETIKNKRVVAVHVQRGALRPYYIGEKGLKPSGVYVRQGSASVPTSEYAIRQMIKDTDGEKFEDVRSLTQDLTFEKTSHEFHKRRFEFGENQMKTLGLISMDSIFTNLGLLLSDQCIHTLKAAVFSSNDKSEFKDRREFSGSLLKQLLDAYEYIDIHNRTKAEFFGLARVDERDYPVEAIREALLNSLVHRDYSYSGSTLINIYTDKIEFVSLGGLVQGLSINDIMLGISQPRNEKLAEIFYRLGLVEAYGTGMAKIMASYKHSLKQPELKVSDHAFAIALPNLNAHVHEQTDRSAEQILLEHLHSHRSLTRKDVEELLAVGQTTAGRILRSMVKNKLIHPAGSGRNTKYTLTTKDRANSNPFE